MLILIIYNNFAKLFNLFLRSLMLKRSNVRVVSTVFTLIFFFLFTYQNYKFGVLTGIYFDLVVTFSSVNFVELDLRPMFHESVIQKTPGSCFSMKLFIHAVSVLVQTVPPGPKAVVHMFRHLFSWWRPVSHENITI